MNRVLFKLLAALTKAGDTVDNPCVEVVSARLASDVIKKSEGIHAVNIVTAGPPYVRSSSGQFMLKSGTHPAPKVTPETRLTAHGASRTAGAN